MATQARRYDKRVGRQHMPVLKCTHHGLKRCQGLSIRKAQQDQGSTTRIYASGDRDFAQSRHLSLDAYRLLQHSFEISSSIARGVLGDFLRSTLS